MSTRTGIRTALALLAGTALAWAWRSAPPALTRGPYLQATGETGLTLVCKTATSTTARLVWGRRAGPPWEFEQETGAGTTHVFTLTGLRPETRYEYELSAGGSVVASGPDCAFRTSPPAGSRAPFRFVAWGDSGTGNTTQMEVAAQLELVQPQPSFALGLGDLVYNSGEWENYDPRLFAPYDTLFRRATFWPALGNHDVETENGAPYLDAFYLPTTTGAPGHPSSTERYYSFDHGQAHFVCLDSESTSTTPGGAMHAWLEADLDSAHARGKRWLFVFMHHPPYTHGTHDSDSESDLQQVHDDLVPLFDAKDVDMVLTGHSHVYERSFLARNDAILQGDLSDYSKISSPDGTLYLVTGCGGKTGSGTLDHPLMARSYGDVAGFNILDVSWEEVQASFVESDGRTTDLFRIRKAADTQPPRLASVRASAAAELEVIFDEPVQAGTGTAGAENTANWSLDPAVAVLAAQLASDQRTVYLSTTSLPVDVATELEVQRVADLDGNAGTQARRFVRAESPGGVFVPVVPQGASWRYAKGSSAPGASWPDLGFDDSAWPSGAAGFGYADADDATVLGDMLGLYASVYVRTDFDVVDPSAVSALALRVSFDDGFVAFLNGSEVARVHVPLNQTATTLASAGHEAGVFESFDLTVARALLRAGRNVLAVEGHNASLTSNDFSLHPELLLALQGAGGAPVAVIEAEVHTANAPARIEFSGARSSDADGPLASLRWDFGDGSALVNGTEVEHLFDHAGTFPVTLTVTDGDDLQAVDELVVRIHTQGSNPVASFAPSTSSPAAGASVSFASGGSLDPDGGTIYRDWDFGDPSSGDANHSALASPTHAFESSGIYTVTLTVVDDEGSTSTESAPVSVGLTGTAPTARFSARRPGADLLERAFTDQSTGDVTARAWDFGDGATSSEIHPVHAYAAAGDYVVVLTVSGPSGSDDTAQTLHIGAGGGGGSGGGGCSVAPHDGRGSGGDPSLALALAAVLLVLAARARPTARLRTTRA
jgi:PKD repeat protein